MKKIYQRPSLIVVSLEGMNVVTASLGQGNSDGVPTNGASAEAPKRRGGIWDEE